MTATSATFPGTARSDSTNAGAVSWSNPTNITANDGSRATVVLNSQTSEFLFGFDFGFSIPTNSVIDGITVAIERSKTSGSGTLKDVAVYLIKGGRIQTSGDNKADTATSWPGSDTVATYGSATDLWGGPWVAADLNGPQFGVVLSVQETAGSSATAGVDYYTVTVNYTSGYESTPRVVDSSTIRLGAKTYRLAREGEGKSSGKVRETLATQFSPKIDTGGPNSRPSNPVIDTYEVTSLRGGLGLWHYDSPKDLERFWVAQTNGIENRYAECVALPPLVTELDNPETSTVNAADDFGGTLMFNFDTHTYSLSGSTWSALLDTLPNGPDDTVLFNSRLFYAISGDNTSGYSWRSATTGAATDVATPTFVKWVVWDNKLYGMDHLGVLYSSTTGLAASWTTLAALPYPLSQSGAARKYTLTVYDDANGDPIIYCVTDSGIWIYDAVNDKWNQSRMVYTSPTGRTIGSRIKIAAVFRESLYFIAGRSTIYRYTMVGGHAEIEDVSPWLSSGFLATYGSQAQFMVADNDQLYVGFTATATGQSHFVLSWTGLGWAILWQAVVTGDSGGYPLLISGSNGAGRVYFGYNTSGSDRNIMILSAPPAYENPIFSSVRTYATSGAVELSCFDGWFPQEIKTAVKARIKVAGATVNETATVSYRLNESTGAYTTLGTAVTVDEEVSLPFGSNGEGVEFRTIQFKLSFARGSTTTLSPKLDHFAMDFIRNPEVLKGFAVRIDLSQDSPDGRTPQQQYDHLYAALRSSTFLTFAYRDDGGNTRSYRVKVMRPENEVETGEDWRSQVTLQLVEVGPN